MRTLLTISAALHIALLSGQAQRTSVTTRPLHAEEGVLVSMHPAFPEHRSAGLKNPETLGTVRWEFGDGSISHIYPPRPWKPSYMPASVPHHSSLAREHCAGSPCAAPAEAIVGEDETLEPRPEIVLAGDQLVLAVSGPGTTYLAVQMMDPLGRNHLPEIRDHYAAGRWTLGVDLKRGPMFITLMDLGTGDRWRVSVAL